MKLEEHDDKDDEHADEDSHEDEEHNDEHEGEDNHEAEHDEHHHGEFDPHTWLDPVLAQDMVMTIAQAMVSVAPDNKTLYMKNAAVLSKQFSALDEAYTRELANCQRKEVIVSHDAYGYVAARYDITLHAIAGLAPEDTPSAKVLAALQAEAAEGITHVLVESNSAQEFAQTLARETGLQTLPLNPLGRGTLDPHKDFIQVMEENLQSFTMALSCQ